MKIPRKAVTVIRDRSDRVPLRDWEGVRIVPAGTSDKPGYLLYFLPQASGRFTSADSRRNEYGTKRMSHHSAIKVLGYHLNEKVCIYADLFLWMIRS